MPTNVKQVKIGNSTYDIEALHFTVGSLDTPSQWKDYIDSLVGEGLQIVIDNKSTQGDYPATPASANTMGKLYLVNLSSQAQVGTYTEFVTVKTGTASSPVYSWEKIGTTAVDLTDYAKKTEAAAATTVDSTTSSTTTSGAAGAATITTTSDGAHTATGTATVSGNIPAATKADSAGGFTISGSNFSVSGGTHSHSISSSVQTKLDHHVFTPSGSIGGSQSIGGHTHTVTLSTVSLWKPTSTTSVLNGATVSSGGVLSFTTHEVWDTTGTLSTVVTDVTVNSGGSHTVQGSNFTFTGTSINLAHTAVATVTALCDFMTAVATITVGTNTIGTVTCSGSQTVSGHTHSISSTPSSITLTGTAAVAVSSHTHSVTISNHTHSISHYHRVTLPSIA